MGAGATFRHEALFYAGTDDLVSRAVPFLRDGATAGDSMLVVLPADKIRPLREALDGDADAVTFADMDVVGRNPGRIIPAWRSFVDANAGTGRKLRGIGEPINTERRGAELSECHRHEALLNVEFADDPPLWLVCPYDVDALAPDVVAEARRTHPLIRQARLTPSVSYAPVDEIEPFAAPLVEPSTPTATLGFSMGGLDQVRAFVHRSAAAVGLDHGQIADLVLAVNEMATNSVQHGDGRGVVRIWVDDRSIVCEVRDRGTIREPLVGRRAPSPDAEHGRGHWLANQLCDLVQLHSNEAGTAVRLHMHLH